MFCVCVWPLASSYLILLRRRLRCRLVIVCCCWCLYRTIFSWNLLLLYRTISYKPHALSIFTHAHVFFSVTKILFSKSFKYENWIYHVHVLCFVFLYLILNCSFIFCFVHSICVSFVHLNFIVFYFFFVQNIENNFSFNDAVLLLLFILLYTQKYRPMPMIKFDFSMHMVLHLTLSTCVYARGSMWHNVTVYRNNGVVFFHFFFQFFSEFLHFCFIILIFACFISFIFSFFRVFVLFNVRFRCCLYFLLLLVFSRVFYMILITFFRRF